MADKVKITETKAARKDYKPNPKKVAGTDDSKYAAEMAYKHGRPCESSAVFETWAQH
ncbi:hypothetical protein JET14_03245 [Martelella lutilitoris]|uniref:Uncharacterized protein n=1 Tax=Martelella lutilitoris TaxID=2583532 RepID=A0A7T7HL65_9HYPH|nr:MULTISPECIES: hypothetical protein [Martelella]QQM31209.1 hypothetical protein JET14_03245 [Martelella lutilitoris]|tara:strand:- start:693 stop:863 length:171 start_codon:yes stop_codon:yes gene_type:complete